MRVLCFLAISLAMASNGLTQSDKNNPRKQEIVLTGKVIDVSSETSDIKKRSAGDLLTIRVGLNLKNTGNIPVIFLADKFTTWASIWESNDEHGLLGLLAEEAVFLPSFGIKNSEWKKIKSDLDKSSPPEGNTWVLMPGQAFNFEDRVLVDLPLKPNVLTREENSSLRYLKEVSPVWLNLKVETWDKVHIEVKNSNGHTEKPKFYRVLKNRWKKFGYLWLEDITSEPIMLELKSI